MNECNSAGNEANHTADYIGRMSRQSLASR